MALLASAPWAQIDLSGSTYDGSGGPLLAGQVYHATSSLTVPTGQTLTIEQGAILKFFSGRSLTVSGTLDVNGSGGAPVILSSIFDDSAGGD
ncbi:MAG: hypothetical protein DRQ55_01730, partial [Planctomycetota bacterium]